MKIFASFGAKSPQWMLAEADRVLRKPAVFGISLRLGWAQCEPASGEYDFKFLGAVLDLLAVHGKHLLLRVIAGVSTPEWVYAEGAKAFPFSPSETFNGGESTEMSRKMPVPWDEAFLARWNRFVRALAAFCGNRPELWGVQMAGGGWIGEMILPSVGEAKSRWLVGFGFTEEKIVYAWARIIDSYRTHFPQPHRLGLSIALPLGKKWSSKGMQEVIQYAQDKGCMAQFNGLVNHFGTTEDRYRAAIRGYQGMTGYQNSARDIHAPDRVDRFHRQALIALMDGTSYMELSHKKVGDPDMQVCLQELAHNPGGVVMH